MVMGCGPGGTAAREEGLSTPRQLWLIRQQQSQQQIQRVVEAVLIRLTLVRAEPTEPWDLGGAGHVRPTSGQHHAARRRVLRTRRDPGHGVTSASFAPRRISSSSSSRIPEQAWRLPAPSA